jgi:hypothetical protein
VTPMLIIEYVDGERLESPVSRWKSLRADGVDKVFLGYPNAMTSFTGHSLYWIYKEGKFWVI